MMRTNTSRVKIERCMTCLVPKLRACVLQIPEQAAQQAQAEASQPSAAALPQQVQRRHLLVSGRFNCQKYLDYMTEVTRLLKDRGVDIFMVKTRGPGDEFGSQTMLGLYRALGIIAFCTADYGAKTGIQYETFRELEYAHQHHLRIIPVQLCETFPPEPADEIGRAQNDFVLRKVIHRIIDTRMQEMERVANEITEAWNALQEQAT